MQSVSRRVKRSEFLQELAYQYTGVMSAKSIHLARLVSRFISISWQMWTQLMRSLPLILDSQLIHLDFLPLQKIHLFCR